MNNKRTSTVCSRRSALRLAAVMAGLALAPHGALADTQSDLDDAQARLDEAQGQLDVIASEYEDLSAQQSETLDELYRVETDIEELVRSIDELAAGLALKQDSLGQLIANEYKDGNLGVVDILFGSSSVEEFISNLYCFNKVTEEQTRLIGEVKSAQRELKLQKEELEARRAELQDVSRTQQEQLEAMRGKQHEAQLVIDGLGQEVRDLMAQRDAEILAAQLEAERARQAREVARRSSQGVAETGGGQPDGLPEGGTVAGDASEAAQSSGEQIPSQEPAPATPEAEPAPAAEPVVELAPEPVVQPEPEVVAPVEEPVSYGSAGRGGGGSGTAAAVIAACYSTPSPGLGLCAGWCSNVMMNAGLGFVAGNANDMYAAYCYSSNRADLQPGMAVAVSTHPHTAAGRIYGHIGMYVGNGIVMDNVGYIRSIGIDEWCSFYGQTVPARWGWLNGIVLT